MTYYVFGGTLNPTQSIMHFWHLSKHPQYNWQFNGR